MPIACKYCILTKGLHGSDIPGLPQTEDELFDHMEREHHVVVCREGETQEQADRRVLAKPETCPECREQIEGRLAGAVR